MLAGSPALGPNHAERRVWWTSRGNRDRLLRTCHTLAAAVMHHAPARVLTLVACEQRRDRMVMGMAWRHTWPSPALLQRWDVPSDVHLIVTSEYGPCGDLEDGGWFNRPNALLPGPPPLGLRQRVRSLRIETCGVALRPRELIAWQLHQWPHLRDIHISGVVFESARWHRRTPDDGADAAAGPTPPVPNLRKLTLALLPGAWQPGKELLQALGDLAAHAVELDLRVDGDQIDPGDLVRRLPRLQRARVLGAGDEALAALAALTGLQQLHLGLGYVHQADLSQAAVRWGSLELDPTCELGHAACLPLGAVQRVVAPRGMLTVGGGPNVAGAAALAAHAAKLELRLPTLELSSLVGVPHRPTEVVGPCFCMRIREHVSARMRATPPGTTGARTHRPGWGGRDARRPVSSAARGAWAHRLLPAARSQVYAPWGRFREPSEWEMESAEPEDVADGAAALLRVALGRCGPQGLAAVMLTLEVPEPSYSCGLRVVEEVGRVLERHHAQGGGRGGGGGAPTPDTLCVSVWGMERAQSTFWEQLVQRLPACVRRLVVSGLGRRLLAGPAMAHLRRLIQQRGAQHPLRLTLVGVELELHVVEQEELRGVCSAHPPDRAVTLEFVDEAKLRWAPGPDGAFAAEHWVGRV